METPSVWAPLRARPAAFLALWALPSAAIALLTAWAGGPAGSEQPTPAEVVATLLRFMAVLSAGLFVLAWFAAPTAALARGEPLGRTVRALARPSVLGVSAALAFFLTLALMLTLLPGLMAGFVNALMAQIFLAVGTIGGAAAAIGLFGRWMHAPALAAEGLGIGSALDASRAEAKVQRNFGFALGLAVLLFVFALAGGALSVLAGRGGAGATARAAASWLPLWVGLAAVEAAVAGRRLQGAAGAGARAPTLALRSRPSRCPACGVLASAPVTGPGSVTCPACGLQATLR